MSSVIVADTVTVSAAERQNLQTKKLKNDFISKYRFEGKLRDKLACWLGMSMEI